jgi:Tfp pilus assembly pilus retraction ATPase PilT
LKSLPSHAQLQELIELNDLTTAHGQIIMDAALTQQVNYILVAGPTDSGKTRVMHSLAERSAELGQRTILAEDYPEYAGEGRVCLVVKSAEVGEEVKWRTNQHQTAPSLYNMLYRMRPDRIALSTTTAADIVTPTALSHGHSILTPIHSTVEVHSPFDRLRSFYIPDSFMEKEILPRLKAVVQSELIQDSATGGRIPIISVLPVSKEAWAAHDARSLNEFYANQNILTLEAKLGRLIAAGRIVKKGNFYITV